MTLLDNRSRWPALALIVGAVAMLPLVSIGVHVPDLELLGRALVALFLVGSAMIFINGLAPRFGSAIAWWLAVFLMVLASYLFAFIVPFGGLQGL